MTSFIEQIKNIAIIDTDTGLMKVPEESMLQLDEIITEAKKMAQKPKKAPNAFIIFKSKLVIDKDEVSGRGTLAKVAKERWENLSVSERAIYVNEYEELRDKQARKLVEYNDFFGISAEEEKESKQKKKLNADGTPKKRGRPRKNKNVDDETTEEENGPKTEKFKCKGVNYLWDKSNDEVIDSEGNHIGYKTQNGFTPI
jgi:hypothetical protein